MDQQVKFYQTGTFTVGNRLLSPEQRTVQAQVERSNSLNSGHRACRGAAGVGSRYSIDAAMVATGNQLIAVNATGCLEVFSTPYPETSWQIPWIHSLFGNAAAVATGVAAAQRALGRTNVRVIAQGGDGGTTDIGFGCLSGMFERNDDVLYICYDNEAYMNTGVQRSSATPPAARTATTPQWGPPPATCSAQAKTCRASRGKPDSYVRPRAFQSGDSSKVSRDGDSRRRAKFHVRALPPRLGWRPRTRSSSRAGGGAGLFPCSKQRRQGRCEHADPP